MMKCGTKYLSLRRAMPYAKCFCPFRAYSSPEKAVDISIGHRPMKVQMILSG